MGLLDEIKETASQQPTPKPEVDWLGEEKETILLYGPPKCGKTWAYCSLIEKVIKDGGHVYIINTDGGVSKTFKQYFGEKVPEVRKSITFEFCADLKDLKDVVDSMKQKVNSNDLVIIDLISTFWDMAQRKFIEEASKGNPIDLYVEASKNPSKFGAFTSTQWQYIKSVHNYITQPFTSMAKCNVIGVCAQKNLEVLQARTGGKNKKPEYEAAGAYPAGEPNLAHDFNTIVYVNKLDTGLKHYFQIMGDRGAVTDQKMISFDKEFWSKFEEERKKRYK